MCYVCSTLDTKEVEINDALLETPADYQVLRLYIPLCLLKSCSFSIGNLSYLIAALELNV